MVKSHNKKLRSNLDKKSARVIIYSDYALKNPEDKVVNHLKQHVTLTRSDMKTLNISGEVLGQLIKICQSEWVLVKEMTRQKDGNDPHEVKCDLCDQPNLERLFFVKNKITNKIMCIGSTCVEEYGVKKVDAKLSFNKYLVENYIAENLPNLNLFLENNRKLSSKFSLISTHYLRKWENQIDILKKAKETSIKRPDASTFSELKNEWEHTLKLENEIEMYLSRISHQELFPKKEIVEWINKCDEKETLQKLIRANGGLIGKNSFSRIWEFNYIQMLLNKIQKNNGWIDITNLNKNSVQVKFKLVELRAFSATLTLNIKGFLETFTEFIFDENYNERNIENELIEESKFERDSNLYIRIFEYFRYRVEKCGYTVIETSESTEIILYMKGYYYLINGEKFSNNLKVYYLNQDERNPKLMDLLINVISESTESKYNEEQWKAKIFIEKNQDELIRNKIAR